MSTFVALSVGCARTWVYLYTLGLPGALKEQRRSEIDSDLWEQQWLASRRGDPPLGIAIEILMRMLLGLISDITWRAEARRSDRTEVSARADRSIKVKEPLYLRGLVLAGIALALVIIIGGGGAIFNAWEDGDNEGWVLGGTISVFAGAAIITGLLLSRRRPALGVGLVALGAIAIIVLWHWLAVITIPVGVGLVALAYFRGRRAAPPAAPGSGDTPGAPEGRWKWLLSLVALCSAAVVGIWLYAITLETWAGTTFNALAVCAFLAFVVGSVALAVLISDLVQGRWSNRSA